MAQSITVPTRLYFEDILPRTGWGLYFNFMIAMACIASFTHATAFFALPFSIALSTCEHRITEEIILTVHASFVLGRIFGGLLINPLCDIYGRKRLITHTMLIIFLSTFMCAFAYSYYVIVLSAVVLASGLETNYCAIRVHLAEILPLNRRGRILSLCDLCWSIGYVFVSLMGLFLKDPLVGETKAVDMQLSYWRMLFAIAGGLNITLSCATALLEESPRYFLHIRKNYLALLTLKQFYAINKSSYGDTMQIREAEMNNIVDQDNTLVYPEPQGFVNYFKRIAKILFENLKKVFSKEYLKTTMSLLHIKLSLLILWHLDLNILLAKHSLDIDSHVQSGIEVIHLDSLRNMTMCHKMEENETLYYIYFILICGIFMGIVIAICMMDYVGRRILSCVGLVVCGSCYVTIFCIRDITGKIILSSISMASFSAVSTTVSVINIESYPTAVRCTAWGILNLPGLLISHFAVRYYYIMADYYLIIHACIFMGAAIAALFLKDLKNKPMIE